MKQQEIKTIEQKKTTQLEFNLYKNILEKRLKKNKEKMLLEEQLLKKKESEEQQKLKEKEDRLNNLQKNIQEINEQEKIKKERRCASQKKFEKIDDEKFLNYIKKFELNNNNNNDFNILTSRDDSLLKTMIKQKTKNLYLKRHKLNLSLEKNSLDNTQINNSNNNKNYFILNTKEINPKNIKHITKKSLLNTDRFTTKYHVQRLLNQKHNLNKFINNNKNPLENDIHNNNTTINNSINITINNYSKTIENNKNNNNRKRKWKSIEKEKTNQSLIHPFKINEESSFYPNEKILNTESNQNNKIKTEEIIIKSYNEKKNKINNNNNNEDKMLINKLLKMQKNYSKNKNSFSHKSFDHRTLIKNRNKNNK